MWETGTAIECSWLRHPGSLILFRKSPRKQGRDPPSQHTETSLEHLKRRILCCLVKGHGTQQRVPTLSGLQLSPAEAHWAQWSVPGLGTETLGDSGQLWWELLLSGECQEESWTLRLGFACGEQVVGAGVEGVCGTVRGTRCGDHDHGTCCRCERVTLRAAAGMDPAVGRHRGRQWEDGASPCSWGG